VTCHTCRSDELRSSANVAQSETIARGVTATGGAQDVNSWKTIVRMLEMLCHTILVAAQLRTLQVRVRHGHDFDVIFFDTNGAAAVPNVRVQGIQLACAQQIMRQKRDEQSRTHIYQETWFQMTSGESCGSDQSFRMTRTAG
jgi:hypothetical protein